MKNFHSLICAALILMEAHAQGTWTQQANYGGGLRDGVASFSINSKGYFICGVNMTTNFQDCWEYDTTANTWTQKANFPGDPRRETCSFTIGNKGYVGTGWNGTFYYRDFWEYSRVLNTWSQKADFGGVARNNAVGFVIGNKGYIGTGFDGFNYTNDFWEYDQASDTWTRKADFAGSQRWLASSFSIGTKGYLGTGSDSLNSGLTDFWEYDPVADTWQQKNDFEGGARRGARGLTIGPLGYLGLGRDSAYFNDFWEYNPINDAWTRMTDFGGTGRTHSAAFAIGNRGFFGTGNDGVYTQDFWKFSPTFSWQPCPANPTVSDGSHTYMTVQIGNQCWFHENLVLGNEVSDVTLQLNNTVVEKSCYNSSTADCDVYGGIYSWDEAMSYSTNPHGICPIGWHIPSLADFQSLATYLGAGNAGEQLKVTPDDLPMWDGNNLSGFTALPGGIGQGITYLYQGSRETFWTSTEYDSSNAWCFDLSTGSVTLNESHVFKQSGFCVRCLQDNTTGIQAINNEPPIFALYPNPSTGNVNITVVGDIQVTSIEIFNALGEKIKSISFQQTRADQPQYVLHRSEFLSPGIYFIKVTSNLGSSTKRITILN